MADPRTLHLDGPTRPWSTIMPPAFCPACRGALPPAESGACSTCGEGTPQGLPRPVPPPARSMALWPNLPPEPDRSTLLDEAHAALLRAAIESVQHHAVETARLMDNARRQLEPIVAGMPEPTGFVEIVKYPRGRPWWRRIWRRERG